MNDMKWHVVFVPEDEIYHDMAKGFMRGLPMPLQRQVKIENPAGGWKDAYKRAAELQTPPNAKRIVIVLTDFDSPAAPTSLAADDAAVASRREKVDEVRNAATNVFIIGPLQEAENLKKALTPNFGRVNRPDVQEETSAVKCGILFASERMVCERELWNDDQLRHSANQSQLEILCPLLQRKFAAEAKGARS